jgi:hypothetical protein
MNLTNTAFFVALVVTLVTAHTGIGYCENPMHVNLCQELLNQARSYEGRASQHGQSAKGFMSQIEQQAKLPTSRQSISGMDQLFSQYDQHRSMENKFRELYKRTTEEAERCMKAAR